MKYKFHYAKMQNSLLDILCHCVMSSLVIIPSPLRKYSIKYSIVKSRSATIDSGFSITKGISGVRM
jgi:hypothetical protein